MTEQTTAGARPRPGRRVTCDRAELKRRRIAAGFPLQKDLAERAGLSTSAVSRAETTGITSPDTLTRIATALGCAPRDLMPRPKRGRS